MKNLRKKLDKYRSITIGTQQRNKPQVLKSPKVSIRSIKGGNSIKNRRNLECRTPFPKNSNRLNFNQSFSSSGNNLRKRSNRGLVPSMLNEKSRGDMSVAVLKAVENRFMTEIKTATTLYNNFTDNYIYNSKDPKKIKASSLQTTLKKLNAIFTDFFSKIDKKHVKVTLSLYIFVFKYFSEKYSKVAHTKKNYKQLFRSLVKF